MLVSRDVVDGKEEKDGESKVDWVLVSWEESVNFCNDSMVR